MRLGITYSDLNGITEIVPNKEYRIRLTTGDRVRKVVHGNLMKAITEKEKLGKQSIYKKYEQPKEIKKTTQNVTLEEAVIRTFDYLVELGENTDAIDLNTVYDYLDRINSYVYDYFSKDMKMSALNENKIKSFVSYLFEREKKDGSGLLSLSTIKRIYSAFSWVIRFCSDISDPPLLKENYLNKIIFKNLVPKGRSKTNKKKKGTSSEKVLAFKEIVNSKANIRLKCMINVTIDIGCRDEECIGLKWVNVDLMTGEVKYDEAITSSISKKNSLKHSGIRSKELKSDNSYRTNYLTDETLQLLRNLKTFKKALGLSVEDNDYIFTVWDDNTVLSPNSYSDEFSDFKKKYNLGDITPYDFRRHLSNMLLESGVSPKDAAKYMGNTPRTLLEHYANINEETENKIKEIVNEKLRSNRSKIFDIDTIAYVLNCDDKICNNKEAYKLVDFVINKKVLEEEEHWAIENAKSLILNQYPNFNVFCDNDEKLVKAKVDTYKEFNDIDIQLIQDSNYYVNKKDVNLYV